MIGTKVAAGPAEGLSDDRAGAPAFEDTDLAAGREFVADHGADVRFVSDWRTWMRYDGKRWLADDANTAVEALAKRTTERMARDAADEVARAAKALADAADETAEIGAKRAHGGAARRLLFAKKCLDMRALGRMLSAARSEPGVNVRSGPETFNRNPWLLNVANGTVDLRTGELRGHDPADMLTQLCPTAFDPGSPCVLWEKFLDAVFAGDADLIGFVRRLVGVALVGEVTEHVLPILWGGGANGKSVLIEVLFRVLGTDYALKAPPGMMMAKRSEAHPTERADLFGKRLVAVVETTEGAQLDEALVKELSGGDTIRARRMKQDFWGFEPSHTAFMVTNHKPTVRGTDNGIWRRLRMVPFGVTFWNPDEPPKDGEVRDDRLRQDKGLKDKLLAEAPGILAWAVRACLEWQRDGLGAPDVVTEATREFRSEQDQVAQFIAERCSLQPGTMYRSRASTLYKAYKEWAEASGEKAISSKKFGPELERLGLEKKTSNGVWYVGVMLGAGESADPIPD